MINVTKSHPSPDCLEKEKKKKNGNYACGNVLDRLTEEFHNKCYICEHKAPVTLNVEHLIPHKGNLDLKFSWNNLLLSCGHCNNIKLGNFDNILNCTDINHKIIEWIKFEINPFPKEEAKIFSLKNDDIVKNTVKLLNSVYNGTTKLKKIESSNLRQKLIKEVIKFQSLLFEYFSEGIEDSEKEYYLLRIESKLKPTSAFTAFKVWIILDNPELKKEFGKFIQNV